MHKEYDLFCNIALSVSSMNAEGEKKIPTKKGFWCLTGLKKIAEPNSYFCTEASLQTAEAIRASP